MNPFLIVLMVIGVLVLLPFVIWMLYLLLTLLFGLVLAVGAILIGFVVVIIEGICEIVSSIYKKMRRKR